jgi:hypothetical protein
MHKRYIKVTLKTNCPEGEMKRMLSKALTGKEPDYGVVTIEPELFKKIEDHARQKGITVDREANDLLELAIKVLDVHMAAKDATKGADQEL